MPDAAIAVRTRVPLGTIAARPSLAYAAQDRYWVTSPPQAAAGHPGDEDGNSCTARQRGLGLASKRRTTPSTPALVRAGNSARGTHRRRSGQFSGGGLSPILSTHIRPALTKAASRLPSCRAL